MLVLSRKTDESVVVGEDDGLNRLLKVTVLEIRNGIVRLGFEANDDVPIHRSEVWERIAAQQRGLVALEDKIKQITLPESLPRPSRQLKNSSIHVRRITARQSIPGKRRA